MLHMVSWYEGDRTHGAITGDAESLFSLLWLLDNSEGVKQWVLDCGEGGYKWAVISNWKKWKSWKDWEY